MQTHKPEASSIGKLDALISGQANRVCISTFLNLCDLTHHSLDHTEFEAPFIPSTVAHLPPIPSGSRVVFRGVLLVLSITHLTDKGAKFLDSDFKERITSSTLNGVKFAKKYSSYNLKSIFKLKAEQKKLPKAEQLEVRVLIQGHMNATASFMRCKLSHLFNCNLNSCIYS
jgi:hypothetical protein